MYEDLKNYDPNLIRSTIKLMKMNDLKEKTRSVNNEDREIFSYVSTFLNDIQEIQPSITCYNDRDVVMFEDENITTEELIKETSDVLISRYQNLSTSVTTNQTYDGRFNVLRDISTVIEANHIINQSDKQNEIAINHGDRHNSFTYKQIQTLQPEKWLVNTIVQSYCEMLSDRDIYIYKTKTMVIYPINFFDITYFGSNKYVFKEFYFKKNNLEGLKMLYFPALYEGHYFLLSYNFDNKTISYYDSMFEQKRGRGFMNVLSRYISELYKLKGLTLTKSEIVCSYVNNIPQQDNGSDCGIYMLAFLDLLIDHIPLTEFKCKHVPTYRQVILCHLFKNYLAY